MKKLSLFPVLLITIVFSQGCLKDKSCKTKSVSSEAQFIEAYAATNGITATAHSSGLYYQIIDPGSGSTASPGSKIFITYTGKLMNGTVFDEQTTANTTGWTLSGLIQGWVIGIPLIQKGGHIKLIIPSALGYGCDQYYSIPGNSILYFDIHLVDVQ